MMTDQTSTDHLIRSRDELEAIMAHEVRLLRELLSNLKAEQNSHLHCQPEQLQGINQARETLMESLGQAREERIAHIKEIAEIAHQDICHEGELDQERSLALLREFANEDDCKVLLLREQMLALLAELRAVTESNNHLLQGKIQQTKGLMDRLQPNNPNTTYNVHARPKVKTATLRIINQEV